MASSNRHWPSMFRSKPCNPQHQWQHDINSSILPSGCHRTPFSSPGCEERTPEPKPRWNPKPEQIRILEAIFDSGMVNPPRDEIRKIRAQLQEFGQVGDANVFYWFQNRKSRSKQKLRHLQNSSKQQKQNSSNSRNVGYSGHAPVTSSPSVVAPAHSAPSGSSPSEKSSPITTQLSNETTALSLGSIINQADYFPITTSATGIHEDQFLAEMPLLFPPQQGFYFPTVPPRAPIVSEQTGVVVGPGPNLLLSELLGNEKVQGGGSAKMTSLLGYPSLIGAIIADVDSHPAATAVAVATSAASTAATTVAALSLPGENNHFQVSAGVPGAVDLLALGEGSKSTVFINDVAFQVSPGPFNVREAFGDDAVLINSAGQLVVIDQWGVTLQSLQHGASYYLI